MTLTLHESPLTDSRDGRSKICKSSRNCKFSLDFFIYILQFPTYAYCLTHISPFKYCISMAFEFPQHANSSIIHKPCSKLQYQVICLQGCKLVDVYRYKHAYVI